MQSRVKSDYFLVTCHKVAKREIDEEGYDWEAGPPHYEHFHYTIDGEIDFAPRIIGGHPAAHGEFPAKVSLQTRAGHHFCGAALIGECLLKAPYRKRYR